MKRELYKNFDYARNIEHINAHMVVDPVEQSSVEVKKTPQDALLSVIYAIDERTKLPTGDLVYYVSDSVNPQIKEFILKNLLMDVSAAANPTFDTKEISDDLALDLMRQPNETPDDYRIRLNEFASSNKEFAQRLYEESLSPGDKPSASVVDE